MQTKCKLSHTGFWEYLIAIAFQAKGKNSFTIQEMMSKVRELEQQCLLAKVTETTIVEQLISRCCAQGSTSFDSLLNYFNREQEGVYSLFNPRIHVAISERANEPYIPPERIIKHIAKWHHTEIRCILEYLRISVNHLPFSL
jgi:hypothetical protein